jgi:hypothetical protein
MSEGELDQHKASQLEELNDILNDGYKESNIYKPHFLNILDIFKSIKDEYDVSIEKSKIENEYTKMLRDLENCKGEYNNSFAELRIKTFDKINISRGQCKSIADFHKISNAIKTDTALSIKQLNDAYIKAQKDVLLKEYDYYVFLEDNYKLSEEQDDRKMELEELLMMDDDFGF